MPDSPFSPDRLREMRFEQGWRFDQIATLATALTGHVTVESDVRDWYRAAGLRTADVDAATAQAVLQDAGLVTQPAARSPRRSRPISASASARDTAWCSACKTDKPVSSFSPDKTRSNGRASICHLCMREKSKAYYQANRDRRIAQVRANKAARKGQTNGPN